MPTSKTTNTKFDTQLHKSCKLVNKTLQQLLAKQTEIEPALMKAVRYTLDAPGKRIRPAIALWCCELVSGQIDRNTEIAAAAIEMVHTYSLIHDDLPAMDDDDFRRGRPTCHKAFDEATAVLTGDALLTLAFEVLARQIDDSITTVRLIAELAHAAGPAGMIAGQMADLKAEKTKPTLEMLQYIHTNKTARLFRAAAAMGAICGGADKNEFDLLCEYGLKIGLGFQIADDILDVCGSTEKLGKTAGKDEKAAKCTYPAVFGLEKSRKLEKDLADQAIAALESFGPKADTLRNLAAALLERTS
jgi:geranylgeranyl diphosphate synthase type II